MEEKPSTFRHWATLAACCGIAASSIGLLTNPVGVFYTPVSTALEVGRGAFAFHASLTCLATGFLSPLVARLMKKYPIRLLLGLGVLFSCGATAMMAFARNITTFYVLGLLKGVGVSMFSLMPVTAIIGNWFEARHGLATGIALSFSGLSGAIFSPVLTQLILGVGWQKTYLIMAAIAALLALPGVLTLHYTPAEVSLPPYGGTMEGKQPAGQPAPSAVQQPAAGSIYGASLVLLVCFTFFNTAITGIAQHFPGMAGSWSMAAQVGATMVSAGMIGNIVSKLLIGVLSDKAGPFLACTVMACTNMAALAVLLLAAPGSSAVALAAAFFYGAVYSVSATGIPLLTRRFFGAGRYASAYSIITLFTQVGSASALTIVGLVYDLTGGYAMALVGGILLDCANLVLLALLRRREKTAAA